MTEATSPAIRRAFRWALNIVLPALLTVAFIAYVYSRRDSFDLLGAIAWWQIAVVAALTLAGLAINALEFGVLYRAMGSKIGYRESVVLFSAGQLWNYLPGQMGTTLRFRYMKHVHGLAYVDAGAAYSANFVISVFATGVVGVLGVFGLWLSEGTMSWVLFGTLLGLIVIAAISFVVPVRATRKATRLGRLSYRLAVGWNQARKNYRASGAVLALEVLRYALLAVRMQIAFTWVGIDEPYLFYLVIGPVGALASFVAITPAGLGIREAAIAAAVVALGRPFAAGLLGSTADRLIGLGVVVVVGLPSALLTARRLARTTGSEARRT